MIFASLASLKISTDMISFNERTGRHGENFVFFDAATFFFCLHLLAISTSESGARFPKGLESDTTENIAIESKCSCELVLPIK